MRARAREKYRIGPAPLTHLGARRPFVLGRQRDPTRAAIHHVGSVSSFAGCQLWSNHFRVR